MTFRRVLGAIAVVLCCANVARITPNAVFAASATPIFRVFLKNGTALACWGEYARVGDRLVLTVPIGRGARAAYEFVSLPVDTVDLEKTERYAESVRAAQFAANRGKAEYAALTQALAAELTAISLLPPKERLARTQAARARLVAWAETSHGYRASDVDRLVQKLDASIVNLRVAAGETQFSLNLSGGARPVPPPKLRADPTTKETVELAVKAAMAVDSIDIRKKLLRRARTTASILPKNAPGVAELTGTIAREWAKALRVESAYVKLDLDVRRLAESAVDRGDVRAIDALRERVTRTDRLLGHQRSPDIASLLETLDGMRERAAEQRLMLDAWDARRGALVGYQRALAHVIKVLDGLSVSLMAIKEMSGPPVTSLVTSWQQTEIVSGEFAQVKAPDDAAAAHVLFGLALEQAGIAVRGRMQAVDTRQLATARDAASAAEDALVRLAQAKSALAALLAPPKAIR